MMENPTERIKLRLNSYAANYMHYTDTLVARLRAKDTLETALAEARTEGRIEGKNEDDRKANARILLAPQFQAVADTEIEVIRAKAHLDIATAELEAAKLLYSAPFSAELVEAA